MSSFKFRLSRTTSTKINSIFFLLILFLSVVTVSVSRNRVVNGSESSSASERTQIQSQKSYWTCPMHPQIHEESPGKCPICSMKLVKAEETSDLEGRSPSANT